MGFLKRYDGELRETLFRRQGSQVSMRMAMGSGSLLSSHGRGIGPQDVMLFIETWISGRNYNLDCESLVLWI